MTMNLLAVLAEAHGARACLDGALAAATVASEATIEALHVKVDPDHLVTAPEEVAIQRMREKDEGTAEDRAQAVRQAFDTWMSEQSAQDQARVTWRELVGAEQKNVLQEARHADLLVLARPQDMDAHDAFHAAVFEAHRPLLIPPDWTPNGRRRLGERIAIAWHATDQARRAIAQAEPWLRQADSVVVLAIGDEQHPADAGEAQSLLAKMGIDPEVVVKASGDGEPGRALLDAVGEVGADALVMGAYRHNWLVEWALGGTTRYILANAAVPLLLAH